jgi:hypothetical protein
MRLLQFFSTYQITRNGLLTLGLCLLLVVPCSGAKEQNLRLYWNQLDQVVTGHKVQTVLADGTALEGKVLAVLPAGLKLKIGKTSDPENYPKGEGLIPREQVKVLRFTQIQGSWRGWGTAIGAGAGVVPGGMLAVYGSNEDVAGSGAIAAGVIAGGAVAGYFAGRSADKRVTTVTVVSDSAASSP